MKATEILSEIKNVLGIDLSEQTPKEDVKLAVEKLSNGTEITTEDQFVPGAAVFIVTEDGDVALPVGEYEMMDNGQTLVVEEEGIIAEIKDSSESEDDAPAEEEVEAAEEEAPEDEKIEAEYVTKEEFAAAVNEIKEMIEEKFSSSEDLAEETPAENVEVKAEIVEAELASQPIVHNPEAETAKFNFTYQDNVRQTRNQRIKSILNKL